MDNLATSLFHFLDEIKNKKVIAFHDPADLEKKLDLHISEENVIEKLDELIDYCVNTQNKFFFNQLYVGADKYAILGNVIATIFNTSAYTYEIAPLFTIMEKTLLKKIQNLFFQDDGETSDALFCPGGSMANLNAMHLARFHKNAELNTTGINNPRQLKILITQYTHYSIKKSAVVLGIGTENIIIVPTTVTKTMDPIELEKTIKREGAENILMIVATAGTTVFGSIDDIGVIVGVAKRYSIWVHVDAALGGTLIFSERHRDLLVGIEKVDSITWNAHKMMQIPLQNSILLIRHRDLAQECNSSHAAYLFQSDKPYDTSYDTGDKYIQCGRNVDILKLWLPVQIYGFARIGRNIDKSFDNTQYFLQQASRHPNFVLVDPFPQLTNVCFWYVPDYLRHDDPEYKAKLNEVAPAMKRRMLEDGEMMMSYQAIDDLPNFFRIVFINPQLEYQDIDRVIDGINEIGKSI